MYLENKATIEKIQWKDIRNSFRKVNPELAKIIDDLDPGPEYSLYKAVYPFGSLILKNGYLYVPNQSGALVSLHDSQLKSGLKDALGYNNGSNPVTTVLKNSVELFMRLEERTIPLYGLVQSGKTFGLWRVLNPSISHNPTFIWEMTSGGRSLLMLPKISKTASHKKLQQKLNIRADIPHSFFEQWNVFREIAKSIDTEEPWCTELLFFSHKWFQSLRDERWLKFSNYLYETAWIGSEFWRNEFVWDMVFSAIQERRNIGLDPYFTNTIKHLLAIGTGAIPAFAPAVDDSAGPVSKIQKIYKEIYNIQYAPIIMQLTSFLISPQSRPVYYSLEYPTIIAKKSRGFSNKITDLVQIEYILNKFLSEMLTGDLNLEHTPFYNLAKSVNYDFFHTDIENHHEIKPSKELLAGDPGFLNEVEDLAGYPFPENSPFVRGCIRVTAKKHEER